SRGRRVARSVRCRGLRRDRGHRQLRAGSQRRHGFRDRGGRVGARVPTGPRSRPALRRPRGLRQACEPLRGPHGVLLAGRWPVRDRGRGAAHGADPRRRRRSEGGAGVAAGGSRASAERILALRRDGAQQQLVALAVKARLARQFVERDPAKTEEMLGQIEQETQTALDDLRDLARGIYPPLLADKGLGSALDAQARKAPFPVRVDADGVGRLPQDVEAAVYFSCLEALQNVAKYAAASEATITITRSPTLLTFTVTDDGRGFEPTAVGSGGG